MLTGLIRTAEIDKFTVFERMKVYGASFTFEARKSPKFDYFLNIINFIPKRDTIKIILQDDSDTVFNFSDEGICEEKYKKFIGDLFDDGIINVKIQIDKNIEKNHFSIYVYEEFVKDILSLSIEEVMIAFSDLFKEARECLVFDVFCKIPMFATKTMFFVPYKNSLVNLEFDRKKRIENCKEVSYFYNFDTYEILPDDFKIDIDYNNNPLSEIFRKITLILSISFIATSANLNSHQLKGIISGQRTMEYCCFINDLPNNMILYRIYNWIYTDGCSIDKAIIARNVISLHCKHVSIIELDEKIMSAIQSNYNLYLKNNVIQYIELKNRVAEFISEIVSRTGEYATRLLDKFKGNLIAIFGSFFTVILANIVSSQPLDNLFTREITTLIESFLGGSFIYLIICYWQSRYEMENVYKSYEDLKKNYNDILTEDDLLQAFGNDELIENMKKNIGKKQKIFLVMWIFFLIVAFLIIEFISGNPNIPIIIKMME